MSKSTFTDAYASVIRLLIALRKERGVSQTELGRRLGKTQQFVSYMELGERRIDIVELYAIAKALCVEPAQVFADVLREMPDQIQI